MCLAGFLAERRWASLTLAANAFLHLLATHSTIEINAAAILMDDRAGCRAATRCGLAVIGTVGLLEQAARRKLVDLPQVMERLRQTNARLDPRLVEAALERDNALKQSRKGGKS